MSQIEINFHEDDKFILYHSENPHIYEAFKSIVFMAISRGYKHWSAKGVFEIIRWKTSLSATGDPFKINNNFTPLYARMFMEDFPEHKGFFRTRDSQFDP